MLNEAAACPESRLLQCAICLPPIVPASCEAPIPLSFSACRFADAHESSHGLAQYDPRLNPEHAIPQPRKTSIPPRISPSAPRMLRAINLHDQPATGANEVTDVLGNDDLTPKRNAELSVHERAPEHRFRRKHVGAHARGARFEKNLSFWGERATAQESLLGPAKRPGTGPFAQPLCQAPTAQSVNARAWRRGCALAEARPRPGPRRRAHEHASIDARAPMRAEERT